MAESDALTALARLLDDFGGSTVTTRQVTDGLDKLSGLPGPRANLTVAAAFARDAPDQLVEALTDSPSEYARMCAVIGLGRIWAQTPDQDRAEREARVRAFASDGFWRVREAVAMALQTLGDADPPALRSAVATWSAGPEPYVARAAIAGICEPRLLRDHQTAAAALDACETATALLLELPSADRRRPDARTLRQALGYCWSVAVAGCPDPGIARFHALDASDPDCAWIIRENSRKARLRKLLAAADR